MTGDDGEIIEQRHPLRVVAAGAAVAVMLLGAVVVAVRAGDSHDSRRTTSAPTTTTRASSSVWSVFTMPDDLKSRSGTQYAQIGDSQLMAFGGGSAQSMVSNDGAIMDLETGKTTDLAGPDVHGGLTRMSAATETDSMYVAIAGLQCVSTNEDPKYKGEDLNTVDACSPGPVTVVVYDAADGVWSRPSAAPYDYGQAFLPEIIGYLNGRVYVAVRSYGPSAAQTDYIRFDVASGSWSRIAPPPGGEILPCLGEPRVAGLFYASSSTYSAPRVVVYDFATDTWSSHRVPEMKSSPSPFGRSCTAGSIIVNDYPPATPDAPNGIRNNLYYAYSVMDGRWTRLPAPPVRQTVGATRASAGDAFVTWNLGNERRTTYSTPASITVGAASGWTARAPLPVGQSDAAGIGFAPAAHLGTRVVSVDRGTVLTADLAQLATRSVP